MVSRPGRRSPCRLSTACSAPIESASGRPCTATCTDSGPVSTCQVSGDTARDLRTARERHHRIDARSCRPSTRDGGDYAREGALLSRGWLDGRVEITVTDAAERERFEAHDENGTLLGVLTYQLTGSIIAYTHTRVEPDFEGHGVGSALAAAAMDDAQSRNR